jgi:hypothetical protein
MATENPYKAPAAEVSDSDLDFPSRILKTSERIYKIAGFMLLGIVAMFILTSVIEIIFLPDPCHYHAREEEAGVIFNLLYDFKASEGFHPTPSLLHLTLVPVSGGLAGLIFGIKRTKK